MVTINLKVSMCRDIIANSNMTKAYFINPCDSCNNDVNTPHNAIHVHITKHTTKHSAVRCLRKRKRSPQRLRQRSRVVFVVNPLPRVKMNPCFATGTASNCCIATVQVSVSPATKR